MNESALDQLLNTVLQPNTTLEQIFASQVDKIARACELPDFDTSNVTNEQQVQLVAVFNVVVENEKPEENLCRNMAIICMRIAPVTLAANLSGRLRSASIAQKTEDNYDALEKRTKVLKTLGFLTEKEIEHLEPHVPKEYRDEYNRYGIQAHMMPRLWELPYGTVSPRHYDDISRVARLSPDEQHALGVYDGQYAYTAPVSLKVIEKVIKSSAYNPLMVKILANQQISVEEALNFLGLVSIDQSYVYPSTAIKKVEQERLALEQVANEVGLRLVIGNHPVLLRWLGLRTAPEWREDIDTSPLSEESAQQELQNIWRTPGTLQTGIFLEHIPKEALIAEYPLLTAFRQGGVKALRDILVPHADFLYALADHGLVHYDKPHFVCYPQQSSYGDTRWVVKTYDFGMVGQFNPSFNKKLNRIHLTMENSYQQLFEAIYKAILTGPDIQNKPAVRSVAQACYVEIQELFMNRFRLNSFPRINLLQAHFSILGADVLQITQPDQLIPFFEIYRREPGFPKELLTLWEQTAEQIKSEKDIFEIDMIFKARTRNILVTALMKDKNRRK